MMVIIKHIIDKRQLGMQEDKLIRPLYSFNCFRIFRPFYVSLPHE